MLKKILVPLDGSELAEGALMFATALSIPTAAKLVLVRAVSAHTLPGIDQREPQVRALAEAEIYLRGVAADLAARGFSVECATPFGTHPSEWIVEEARLRAADLIVMSTHGRTGPGRWLFGSVAEAVVANSPRPVLIQRAWDPSRRELLLGDRPLVLVPLDTSRFAEAALSAAAGIADDIGGALVLVSVDTTPRDVQFAEEDVAYLDDRAPARVTDARDYLADVAHRLTMEHPDVAVTWLVESGDAADAIATAAVQSNAALVVMATHGRTGLLRATLGSVAGQVLQHGSTPLVLVRPDMTCAQVHPVSTDAARMTEGVQK